MIKLGKWITKHRVIILIVAVVLLIPSVLGMIATRIKLRYAQLPARHYGNHTGSGHSAE